MRIFKKNLAKKMGKYIFQNLMSSALFGYTANGNGHIVPVSCEKNKVKKRVAKVAFKYAFDFFELIFKCYVRSRKK